MNINYTQTFEEFASSLGPTDIALYAGAALIVWVLFKEKLNPVTNLVKELLSKLKSGISSTTATVPQLISVAETKEKKEDVFFQLVVSWKQTRDLAVLSGCSEAVKVADQMFPYLSPNVCNQSKKDEVL